jgi:hypothetical protein
MRAFLIWTLGGGELSVLRTSHLTHGRKTLYPEEPYYIDGSIGLKVHASRAKSKGKAIPITGHGGL